MPEPIDRQSRIYVTGHAGLVGSAIVRKLKSSGFESLLTATRKDVDLREPDKVLSWFQSERPDYVIHVAGKVGGIRANLAAPADFLYDNMMIHATVLRAAWKQNVKKLLYLASSCIYPRDCPQPMQEDHLLSSPMEPSNEGYALAKLTGVKSCELYRKQYGCNFVSCLPTNIYGPGDNFDPQSSHVLPALIRKFHEAKQSGNQQVDIWGSGNCRREFLHVDDLADACLFLLENYEQSPPINVGTGIDVSIAELAKTVSEVVYPEAELVFDAGKPEGPPRKLLDVGKLNHLGWNHQIALKAGIESAYDWFLKNVAES